MTLEPMLVLWSDPVANQILLCNIWSYPHYSKHTPLPPSTLSLFRPWLPNASPILTKHEAKKHRYQKKRKTNYRKRKET